MSKENFAKLFLRKKEKCQETVKQVGIFEEEDNTKHYTGPIIEKVR